MRATVRAARTRAAHLLLRMSPGHSRCASIASPAQRGSTHRFPRYSTATWKSIDKSNHKKTREPAFELALESGGYLFVLCAVLSLRLGSRRVRHSECHPRHSFTSTTQAVHIGTLGTALQRGESSVAGTKKESPEGLSLKWRLPTLPQRSAVPSAMLSLTTLFGMGRGGTSAL